MWAKAVNRNQKAGQAIAYTDLRMPAETRQYVPKLQAMKNLVANPQDKGIQLPSIPNHPYFQTVPLPRDMDVALVARLAEVPLEDFKALNPSAHRPVCWLAVPRKFCCLGITLKFLNVTKPPMVAV
jgi:membrane-bound lytic murein transglycosylase D